ncbi:MAG: transcription repressor NadR [Candidatus Heritagella sp.]
MQGTSAQRREKILQELQRANGPVSASALARQFSVSRQIIVGDIALLRASNVDILATPRGYILQKKEAHSGTCYTIACRHDEEGIRRELYTVVDLGGEVVDAIIEHPVYGQLTGPLHVASRFDADLFMERLARHQAEPLCRLTNGVHLHTLRCPNGETFQRITAALREQGILFEKEEEER